MDIRKVKSIALVLLALVNAFLVINLGVRFQRQQKMERELEENTRTVLENRGIAVPAAYDLSERPAAESHQGERDFLKEAAIAAAWIGEAEGMEMAAPPAKSPTGQATFTIGEGGAFSAEKHMAFDAWPAGEAQAIAVARGLLEDAGMELSDSTISADRAGDNYYIELRKTFRGKPVFNQRITVLLKIDFSVEIHGFWLYAKAEPLATAERPKYTQADLLLTASTDWENVLIESMTTGFWLQEAAGNAMRMIPALEIKGNGYEAYIDIRHNQIIE